MHSIQFSQAEIQAIQYDRYHHPDPRVARRMEILLLKHAVPLPPNKTLEEHVQTQDDFLK